MNPTKPLSGIFSLLFVAAIFLSACSSDNGNSPDDDNGNTIANNKNSNLKDGNQYTHRLEFPKLKPKSVIRDSFLLFLMTAIRKSQLYLSDCQ